MYVIPLLLCLLMGIVGVWEKLFDESPKTKTLGILTVVILALGLTYEGWDNYKKTGELAAYKDFATSNLAKVDEASGGTFLRDSAYIVDDDEAQVFVFEWDEKKTAFRAGGKLDIFNKDQEKENNKTLTDLEAAATFADKLYLSTSYSINKHGVDLPARQRFLELEVQQGRAQILDEALNLRESILKRFGEELPGVSNPLAMPFKNQEGLLVIMEIEGLAIDLKGRAYLGFRGPLIDNTYALVLRAPITEILSGEPHFEAFALDLQHESESYGIMSLEFDRVTGDILVLAGSPYRKEFPPPCLWKWEVVEGKPDQQPELLASGILRRPEYIEAKPEALIVPAGRWLHLFLDAEKFGGQRQLSREGIGLPSTP